MLPVDLVVKSAERPAMTGDERLENEDTMLESEVKPRYPFVQIKM